MKIGKTRNCMRVTQKRLSFKNPKLTLHPERICFATMLEHNYNENLGLKMSSTSKNIAMHYSLFHLKGVIKWRHQVAPDDSSRMKQPKLYYFVNQKKKSNII